MCKSSTVKPAHSEAVQIKWGIRHVAQRRHSVNNNSSCRTKLYTVDPWTTWGVGAPKNSSITFDPLKTLLLYSRPSVSGGIGSSTCPHVKSVGVRVPYIKWHRTMHTVGPPHPQVQSLGVQGPTVHLLNSSHVSWVWAVETHVIHGPAVFILQFWL